MILRLDACRLPGPARTVGAPCSPVFLDPPYHSGLAIPALLGLSQRGWLAPGAVLVVELAADEALDPPRGFTVLDERAYGAAKVVFLRAD